MSDLAIIRRAYAKQIMAAAGVGDAKIEAAFAAVPREDFLGSGPWPILRWGRGYVLTPNADPVYLYADVLIGIDRQRDLNNGQPSFHALLMSRMAPAAGDHVVHVGGGTGYYSAVLAHAVGESGRVTAIEYDARLARLAAENLAPFPHVKVVQGDGTEVDFEPADGIYVNAGATRPADIWLDRLKPKGRLILPLTTEQGFSAGEPDQIARRGAVFRIQRLEDRYAAKWLSPVAIFPCAGMRDPDSEAALARALENGGWDFVKSLRRDNAVPVERCWLWADGWCLTYD